MSNEVSTAAADAAAIYARLVRDESNDVLMWLRSYFSRVWDFDTARRWLEMSPDERKAFIDSLHEDEL